MSTFIPRKAHEPGGMGYELRAARGLPPIDIPQNAAGWHSNGRGYEVVTWDQVLQRRRERQRERLERIRSETEPSVRPAQVWTFYIPGWLFSGWWCYLRTRIGTVHCGGPKGEVPAGSELACKLMCIIPLGIPPAPGNFEAWMKVFAARYPRVKTKQDRRRAGILSGWTDGKTFFLERP